MTYFGRHAPTQGSESTNRTARRLRTSVDWMALTVAALALIGSLATPIVQKSVSDDPPTGRTCLQLQLDYGDAINRSPQLREQILPGADGRSSLVDDPQAEYCHLTPAMYGG